MDTGGVADAGRAVRYPLLRRPRGIRRRRIGGFRRPAGTNQQESADGDVRMPFYIHASDPLEKVHLLHGACGTEEIWLC